MKKFLFIPLIFTFLLSPKPALAEKESDCDLMYRAFIEAMLDKMGNAVVKHGTNRLWNRGTEEILEVKRLNPRDLTRFTVTIRVKTFEGAHNPPYAFETMTIKLPEGDVIHYNIKWLEPKK